MPTRAVLNFVYMVCRPQGEDATPENLEKYDADLYAPLDGPAPITEIDLRRD